MARTAYPDLTSLRGILAGWVFCYHLNLQLGGADGVLAPLLHRGYLGVDGFFLLSGLVLAIANPNQQVTLNALHRFWFQRLRRIYPVHLAVLALLAALAVGAALADIPPRDPNRFGLTALLQNLLLIHAWGFSSGWAWNYPSWSISAEFAGYLLFPALWLAVRMAGAKTNGVILLACLAALVLADIPPVGLNLTYQHALLRFFPEFIAGMALAGLGAAPRVNWPLALASLATAVLWLPDWAVVAALLLCLARLLADGLRGRLTLTRIPCLHAFGEISYPFYMSFATAEMLTASLTRAIGKTPAEIPYAYTAWVTALALLGALVLARYVERPAMRLAKRAAPG